MPDGTRTSKLGVGARGSRPGPITVRQPARVFLFPPHFDNELCNRCDRAPAACPPGTAAAHPHPSLSPLSGPVVVVTCPGARSVMSPRHAAGSIFPACPCVCQREKRLYRALSHGPCVCVCVFSAAVVRRPCLVCCARFIDRHGSPRPQPILPFLSSLCVDAGGVTHAQERMTPQTARHALRVICTTASASRTR